jgi:hypothetical protein
MFSFQQQQSMAADNLLENPNDIETETKDVMSKRGCQEHRFEGQL